MAAVIVIAITQVGHALRVVVTAGVVTIVVERFWWNVLTEAATGGGQ